MTKDTIREAAQAVPPISVGGLTLWGVPINEWLIVVTIIYTIFLVVDKIPVVLDRLRAAWQWVKGKHDQSN